ncbi:hypothetical protein VMCG_04422 [Cytospora schulzeri]|uniref:Myb-like domain-containing protein n=1 Tax=Cytospora schulzeri TaxID=448051 RepID=A0A423WSZ4_9PEZI|nr:hypothetical protein VMCG_04422 [Valsa malicola]
MSSEKDDVSSGSGAAPETPKAKPSDKQMNLLAIIMQNIEDQPKINWENVAAQASFKNDRVAKETYRQMCKKFGWGKTVNSPGSAGDTTSKVTKSTGKVGSTRKPRGKKAAAKTAAAAVDDDESGQESGKSTVKDETADAADTFMMSGAL